MRRAKETLKEIFLSTGAFAPNVYLKQTDSVCLQRTLDV